MPPSRATALLGGPLRSSIRQPFDGPVWRILPRLQPITRSSAAYSIPPWPSHRPFHTSRASHASSTSRAGSLRRSCTTGGLLLLGLSSPVTSANTIVASCPAVADSALVVAVQKRHISRLARVAWARSLPTVEGRGEARILGRRNKSSNTDRNDKPPGTPLGGEHKAPGTPDPPTTGGPHAGHESITGSMSKYLQSHLPKMPHRPTREELLAAANGFWERLKVRFKWFSIRSMRPWNADEWGAFVSWFLFGHLVWILVGTTTFFSLVILTVNTVFAQEEIARCLGDYLTKSAGVTVVFESAIVPKWKNGVISFRNVFVSRRPGQVKSSVKKGSPSSAAAMAAAKHSDDQATLEDDGNYTQYDLTINSVDVTLSFLKWWNGRGLLKDVEVKGVRGVVDRNSVQWTGDGVDPLSFRHEHHAGDFEIEHFKLEDLLVTVHQTRGFRPFSVSIYSCELPQLRKQWFFYDVLSANHMSGSYDGSLFTIHPRQVHGVAAGDDRPFLPSDNPGEAAAWKKFSRLRIDGLKIDHLNRGDDGPFGWIYEGNVDIIADIMIPADADEGIAQVLSDFYDKMEEAVTSNRYLKMLEVNTRSETTLEINNTGELDFQEGGHLSDTIATPDPPAAASVVLPEPSTNPSLHGAIPRYLVMDLRLHLNDVRAAVPLFPPSDSLGSTRARSYINAALIRPIVAYINAKRTYIPIACRIVKRVSDFDGAWGVYDCGLMDDGSAEVYTAFARDVEDQQSRVRRLKKVGFWTLSMVVHALLAGVAGDLM